MRSGPVSRVLYSLRNDGHSSRPAVARRLKQPTRKHARATLNASLFGLASSGVCRAPARYRAGRCALTAPFHPYQARPGGLFSVALSRGRPRRRLSGTALCVARTFLGRTSLPRPSRPLRSNIVSYCSAPRISAAALCLFLAFFSIEPPCPGPGKAGLFTRGGASGQSPHQAPPVAHISQKALLSP